MDVSQSSSNGQCHMGQGQRSLGSRSKVTWVKVKGHFGQGQENAQDIGRWAYINVKLHFLLIYIFQFQLYHRGVFFQI